ncbi:hypothetical protein NP493_2380g00001 [Ridgeia piscesae]|uniref:Uncharacterized protein n=1 Tax=Ridgeia piscesae TaxID=27915 RepID=A0AAD9N3I7_RIDPI|nr:hypothetical protein NP493_2380g00001 [Ridgeia piscesae]
MSLVLPKCLVTKMSCYQKGPVTEMSVTKMSITTVSFTKMSWILEIDFNVYNIYNK